MALSKNDLIKDQLELLKRIDGPINTYIQHHYRIDEDYLTVEMEGAQAEPLNTGTTPKQKSNPKHRDLFQSTPNGSSEKSKRRSGRADMSSYGTSPSVLESAAKKESLARSQNSSVDHSKDKYVVKKPGTNMTTQHDPPRTSTPRPTDVGNQSPFLARQALVRSPPQQSYHSPNFGSQSASSLSAPIQVSEFVQEPRPATPVNWSQMTERYVVTAPGSHKPTVEIDSEIEGSELGYNASQARASSVSEEEAVDYEDPDAQQDKPIAFQ
jgi:hypothetical protein